MHLAGASIFLVFMYCMYSFFFVEWTVGIALSNSFMYMFYKGNLRWPVRDMAFCDQFFPFKFTNSKFCLPKLKISSSETRNFEFVNLEILSLSTRNFAFVNSKLRVCKLEISSSQIRKFESRNTKFRVWKFEAEKLITKCHVPYGPP